MNLIKILPFFLFFSSFAAENILFIGNSYTGGIRSTVSELFKQQNVDAHVEFINPGGKTLLFHSKNEKTIAKIKSRDWDKIILQDQSQTPALPGYNKIFHQATADFTTLFRSLKKQPKVYYYLTWGRRDGDKRNAKVFPDFTAMQKLLTENYTRAAKKNGAQIVPVGHAFSELHKLDKEIFTKLYAKDGSHPSKLGSYLAACVFYAALFEKDPVSSIKWNGKLDEGTAVKFRMIAKKVITKK